MNVLQRDQCSADTYYMYMYFTFLNETHSRFFLLLRSAKIEQIVHTVLLSSLQKFLIEILLFVLRAESKKKEEKENELPPRDDRVETQETRETKDKE